MKKLLLLLILCLCFGGHAQNPQLNVKGQDANLVRMSQMKVEVKVVGNRAYTTSEMHFFNGTNRQMEAELLFPLPEGVSVSRYAIDINGKMREAVPVNKNKGKQVFEAIEHRRVDPGLLEKVEGNNFRTRIYPLLPGKERIVIIGYEQELSTLDASHLGYQMVSSYPRALDTFELSIAILGATQTPTVTTEEGMLALENMDQRYQATIKRNHYQPQNKLMVSIPVQAEVPSVVVQTKDDQHYFYATTMIDGGKVHKKNPNSIGLIWDVSLSCRQRDTKKELDLLDAYIKGLNNVEVTLYFSGYTFEKKATFAVKNGDWSLLKTALEQVKYDGGTRYSKIKVAGQDEYLFFTDGLSTLSANTLTDIKKPLYTITSLATADYAFLNYNAMKTGGACVNLNELSIENALNKLVFRSMKFLGVKDNYTVIECYPMAGTPVAGSFSVSGISLKGHNEVTLLFGYEDTPVLEKTIVINTDRQASEEVNLERLWAQKKIANLGLQYKANAEEIETMGKKYGIVTDNTSLIVLETVNDYIQYDIVPPAELRPEFDRWAKQQIATAEARKFSNWENVATYYQSLLNWWNKDIKYPPKPVEQDFGSSTVYGVVSDRTGPLPGANVVVRGTKRATQTDFDGKYHIKVKKGESLVFSFTGFQNQTVRIGDAMRYNVTLRDSDVRLEEVVVEGYRGADREEADDQKVERKTMAFSTTNTVTTTTFSNSTVGSKDKVIIRGAASIQTLQGKVPGLNINTSGYTNAANDSVTMQWSDGRNTTKVNQWSPDRNYLKALAAAPADKRYGLYLDLREGQENNPGFYFDVANYFHNNGDKAMALLILSNIADLSLENHQLYKSLTYVLRQWEAYDDALYTANQVVKWRAQEPQAHRDLALTLEDNQQYQAAFDELIAALNVKNFGEMQGQYEGVEDIILMDINRMLSEHKGIATGKLDKKYTEKMPVSLRIILNWNQMDTDIDLHVVEPTGEECYYGHRDTDAGARFSKDFTQGYGPEQYLLRNPVKGKFIIKTNYFGERALTENGPATVMVEIYTTKNGVTQRTLQTIQLGQVKENQNLAEVTLE